MSEAPPRIGSLASLDPNKAFPINLTSPDSVKGLLLLGGLLVFAVGWAALAIGIYFVWGRKASPVFSDVGEDKKCIVNVESPSIEEYDEDRHPQQKGTTGLANTKQETANEKVYVCAVCNSSTSQCPPSAATTFADDASSTASLHTAMEDDEQNTEQCPPSNVETRTIGSVAKPEADRL